MIAGIVAAVHASFTVMPGQVGVVVRGGEPVRLAQPGLRQAISEWDETALATFDPYVIAQPGSRLAGALADEGLAIDDFSGEVMGYRLAQP